MKNTIILIAILVFGTATVFGQTELKPTIGFNITNVSKDPDNGKAKGQVGWQFGGSILFGNKFYVEPGLMYVKKKTEFVEEGQSGGSLDLGNTDLDGLRVPVAVGYHLLGKEEKSFALRILGGGSAFFVTKVKAEGLTKDDFESPTWGVFAGAGLDIWILFLDLKYEWSLTDVASITNFDVGKSRSFFGNVGVRIKL